MNTTPPPAGRSSPWVLLVMALVPWAAFLIPLLLAAGAGDYDVTAGEFGGAALFTLWVVALPSLLPLAVARNGAARWTTLAFMTVVSGAAGLTVALSDDAQAGLVVLVVPVLAVPVTVGVWIARALGIRRGTRRGAG